MNILSDSQRLRALVAPGRGLGGAAHVGLRGGLAPRVGLRRERARRRPRRRAAAGVGAHEGVGERGGRRDSGRVRLRAALGDRRPRRLRLGVGGRRPPPILDARLPAYG